MAVAEAPGREETARGRGLVGMAGKEWWFWLQHFTGLTQDDWYISNCVKVQPPGNRDPSQAELDYWLPLLEEELEEVQPEVLVTLGRFSTNWALGREVNLQVIHGTPQVSSHGIPTLPCYHPAAGLHETKLYTFFWRDMENLGKWLRGDLWRPRPLQKVSYTVAQSLVGEPEDAVDTEGTLEDPISIQVSQGPSEAVLMPPDVDWEIHPPLVFHNAAHDLRVLKETRGVELGPEEFEDTMMMARVCGDYWAGLKSLAYQLAGMELREYEDVVKPYADAQFAEWIGEVRGHYHPVHKVSPKTGKPLKALEPAPEWFKASTRCLRSKDPRDLWTRQRPEIHMEVENLDVRPLPEFSLRAVPEEEFRTYACGDADATGRIYPLLKGLVATRGLGPVYQIDKRTLPILMRMEERGMRIDPEHFQALSEELNWVIDTTMEAIGEIPDVPEGFSPTSPKQTAELLYYTLGLGIKGKRIKRTKGGVPTTDDAYLQAIRHQHPVVPLILAVREASKLKSAYVDKLPKIVDEEYRYHPKFGFTVSGRLTESLLLLIPKHSDLGTCQGCGFKAVSQSYKTCPECGGSDFLKMGKLIRKGFIPTEGKVFGSWDLSQIELRVLASDSQDPDLLASYRDGIDLHALTAYRVLGAPKDKAQQDPSKHRLPAKTLNFSIAMGITGEGLCREITAALADAGATPEELGEWTPDRCEDMLTAWYTEGYPVAGAHLRSQVSYARDHGYVKDFMGRIRWLPGVNSPNEKVRSECARQAQSYGMQAGAQEVAKQWQWNIWNELCTPGLADPVIMVHDDNVMEFREADFERVNTGMTSTLPQVLRGVPVAAEGVWGPTWGDL